MLKHGTSPRSQDSESPGSKLLRKIPSGQLYEEEEGDQEQAEKGHYSSLPAVRHAGFPLTGREDGNALAHLTRRDSESDSQRSNGGSSSTLRGKLQILPIIPSVDHPSKESSLSLEDKSSSKESAEEIDRADGPIAKQEEGDMYRATLRQMIANAEAEYSGSKKGSKRASVTTLMEGREARPGHVSHAVLRGGKSSAQPIMLGDKPKRPANLRNRRRVAKPNKIDMQGGPKVRALKQKDVVVSSGKVDQGFSLRSLLEERIAWIEKKYVMTSTLEEPGQLGRMFRQAGTRSGGAWHFLHSANPIAGAMRQKRHVTVFFIMGLAFLAWTVSSAYDVRMQGRFTGRSFRFVPLQLRNGSTSITAPSVSDAGVLREGCIYTTPDITKTSSGSELRMQFLQPLEISGWWFRTSMDGSSGSDPVIFSFDMLDEASGAWVSIGSSSWRYNAVQGRYIRSGIAWPTVENRGYYIMFDLRAPWHWALSKIAPMFLYSTTFFLIVLCAIKQFYFVGKYILGISLILASFVYMTSAVADTSATGNWFSFWWWLVIASFLTGVAMITRRRFFVHVLVTTGIGCLVVAIVEYALYIWNIAGFIYAASAGCILLGIAMWLVYLRFFDVNNAYQAISDDRELYNQVWVQLKNQHGFIASLVELNDLCIKFRDKSSIVSTLEDGAMREDAKQSFYDKVIEASFVSLMALLALLKKSPGVALVFRDSARTGEAAKQLNSRARRKGTLLPFANDSTTHVQCLDQIYAQANEVQVLIRKMVRSWAYASRGMFPVSVGRNNSTDEGGPQGVGEWVLWSQARVDKQLEKRILWGEIKDPARAISKTLKRYDGALFRLVDVCRESIYFQSVPDMIACMRMISEERELIVVRVKNRMHLEEEDLLNIGFRHVCINVRVQNYEAEQRGVESHVCEILLILVSFAELMTPERHARYVAFRDVMGT